MYPEREDEPMTNWDDEELSEDDYEDSVTRHNGTETKTRNYRDGSTTYNFGGPCGKAHYDKYGREC